MGHKRNNVVVDLPEDLTLEKLIPIVDDYHNIQPSKTPLCIIKYGPPGSGKTSADVLVEKLFNIDLSKFAKIDKDAPLTAIKSFRNGSMEIIKKYQGFRYKEQPVQKKVVKLQETILETKDKDGLTITEKIPIVLQRAFDYNLNILWETTCQSTGSQQLMDLAFKTIPKVYRIIVLFPIISFRTAKQRVITRAEKHLSETPPYYRPVPISQIKIAIQNSHAYFKKNIVPKVLDGSIYQVFCYNNENIEKSIDYETITNVAVKTNTKRHSRKRIAPGWHFGLNKTHKRTIIKNARKTAKIALV
jgi:hypothetical protein